MSPEELRADLFDLEDVAYREFHLKTCPQAQRVIGVRMSEQRRLAKMIIKGDFWQFLDEIRPYYYEEILVTGIVIASAPMSLDDRLGYVSWFIPLINNWAICDCFCASFKIAEPDLEPMWRFLQSLAESDQEYTQRFRLVMMLDHFLLPQYIEKIFRILDQLKTNYYYVDMAMAWLIAEAFTKFRDQTLEYLRHDQLTDFVHNKAIQKARESRRISAEDKVTLAALRL